MAPEVPMWFPERLSAISVSFAFNALAICRIRKRDKWMSGIITHYLNPFPGLLREGNAFWEECYLWKRSTLRIRGVWHVMPCLIQSMLMKSGNSYGFLESFSSCSKFHLLGFALKNIAISKLHPSAFAAIAPESLQCNIEPAITEAQKLLNFAAGVLTTRGCWEG